MSMDKRVSTSDIARELGDASLGPTIPAAGTGTEVTLHDDPGDLTASARRSMAGAAGYDESRFDTDEPIRADGRWLIERLTGQPA